MAIFRINKTKNYTVMSNGHLRDNTLSMKGKGLLSVMLSLPDSWDYSINGLAAISVEGVTAVKNTLKELQQAGYLVVTKKMPNETTSGRIEYIYDIYENKKQGDRKQGVENLPLENLSVENLSVENQRQLNTNKQNTKELNKEELNKEKEIKKEEGNINNISNINGEGNGENKVDIPSPSLRSEKKKETEEDHFTKCVVGYFNGSCGTDYRYHDKLATRHIRARYRDGYKLEDLTNVIDKKTDDWLNTPFSSNLNLDTLFKQENFEKYRNQVVYVPEEKKKDEYAYNFCSE